MSDMREAIQIMSVAAQELIQATFPMADPDLCEDPRVVGFIHAVNRYADATLTLLKAIDVEEEANA